ncbi:MAG: hypothetical protein HYX60_06500, partial [Legionella longbeachae]|nr:hypothetical protein [Legionella longbeachae]
GVIEEVTEHDSDFLKKLRDYADVGALGKVRDLITTQRYKVTLKESIATSFLIKKSLESFLRLYPGEPAMIHSIKFLAKESLQFLRNTGKNSSLLESSLNNLVEQFEINFKNYKKKSLFSDKRSLFHDEGNRVRPYKTSTFFSTNFRQSKNTSFLMYSSRTLQETVKQLKDYGVSKELIRKNWEPFEKTSDWSGFEKDALIFFVTGQPPVSIINEENRIKPLPVELQLSPEQALQNMSELNHSQLGALMRLYAKGLRSEHLRQWYGVTSTDKIFTVGYAWALVALMTKEGFTPGKAIQKITGITNEAATRIWLNIKQSSNDLSRENICQPSVFRAY